MHKRNLFLILVLFLAILSVSFVSASENVTDEVKDDIVSSVSDEIVIDENIGKDLNENPSSTDLISEPQITNETENIDKAQVLKAGNDEIQISSVEDNQILQAGNPHVDNYTFCNGGTAQQVIETICQLSTAYGNHGGAVLYLNGNTFTGIGEMQSGDNGIIEIKNVKVIGGTVDDPTKMATFTCTDLWHSGGIALNFRGRSSDWGTKF
jgi:cell division protein YceG involved in septum cleavage